MFLSFLSKYREGGLLFLRAGLGISFMIHGIPKLLGGPKLWHGLGEALGAVGIHFGPPIAFMTTSFGFMASFAEGVGGALLVLGLFFRPACFLLVCTMCVATAMLHGKGGDFNTTTSRPLELAIVFASLIFIGPGKYSLDKS